MGRPRKGEIREPTENFTVNLTEDDRQTLAKLAKILGVAKGRVLVLGMYKLDKNLNQINSLVKEVQEELAS